MTMILVAMRPKQLVCVSMCSRGNKKEICVVHKYDNLLAKHAWRCFVEVVLVVQIRKLGWVERDTIIVTESGTGCTMHMHRY